MRDKQYYWLKLGKKFFSKYEIKIILKHPKGSEYVIFWLKLMLEAIESEELGLLRFKENIPYTPEILSIVTDTDIDTVKGALQLFAKLKMIDTDANGDLLFDEVIHEMVGRISDEGLWKSDYRKRMKTKQIGHNGTHRDIVPQYNITIETETEKELKKEKELTHEKTATVIYEDIFKKHNPNYEHCNYAKERSILKKLSVKYTMDEVTQYIDKLVKMKSADPFWSDAPVLPSILVSRLPAIIEYKFKSKKQSDGPKSIKEFREMTK